MKKPTFPLQVEENGVTATIRRITTTKKLKCGTRGQYESFRVDYVLLGERKQVWRSTLEDAKQAASEACTKIANGEQLTLELNNADRTAYLRAGEALAAVGVPIDTACREYAECRAVLAGKASPVEACRAWAQRHAVTLPKISVADAVEQIKAQARADGKSQRRQQQLAAVLDAFAKSFNVEVHTLTPDLVSRYLTGLAFKERTKRNHRDVLGYFFRWLALRSYLPKDADLLEGVQNYTARKMGEISTYSPEEMARLIEHADDRILPFIVIAGFAGLRHAEIARLEWQDVDLAEGLIEVSAANSKTGSRRIVPINETLKAWLLPLAKRAGKVVPVANVSKQLAKLADDAGVAWKHNALRHTAISARLAECKNFAQVAFEAGNSPQVIKSNYDAVLTPKKATAWFAVVPAGTGNLLQHPGVAVRGSD